MQPTFSDLEQYSPEDAKALHNIIATKNVESFQLRFGDMVTHMKEANLIMIQNCSYLAEDMVNDLNKQDYKHLRVQWILLGSRIRQLNAMKTGFFSIAPLKKMIQEEQIIKLPRELALICCGDESISPSQLRRILVFNSYESPYRDYLLELIQDWSSQPEKLRLFIEFVTGLHSLPTLEVLELSGKRIVIQGIGENSSRFPAAHTCMWLLELPHYRSKHELGEKFDMAFLTLSSGEMFLP